MICPHCGQTIEDGSNVCPRCYMRLTGSGSAETAGRKRAKKRGNPAPTIIAVGIILILLVVIALIVRSMFLPATRTAATPAPAAQATPQPGFAVFGRTAVPESAATATPDIAVTATPSPEPEETPEAQEVAYKTLRKGDQGVEVVMLQEALASLGYLTTASDGIYGTGTATAVRSFQSANGLDADGIAGRQTQALLFAMTNITPIPVTTPAPGDILDLPG